MNKIVFERTVYQRSRCWTVQDVGRKTVSKLGNCEWRKGQKKKKFFCLNVNT